MFQINTLYLYLYLLRKQNPFGPSNMELKTMKWIKLVLPFLYLVTACTNSIDKQKSDIVRINNEQHHHFIGMKEVCWTGTLNKRIPVFLHYTFQDKLLVGEITYLNTKEKKPIKVIGTIEEDTSYTLLQFEPNGNNTGIITGKPQAYSFDGTWFSPETQNEQQLSLIKKDTVLNVPDFRPDTANIYGNYHYQFSEYGYQGFLKINKLKNNHISFSIFSVTEHPERNIADVPTDTIPITGNSFRYKLPESDSCEFIVTFYNGFATVDYTKGNCNDQFGMNATIDGVFIKVN